MIAWVLDFLGNRPQYVVFNENSFKVLETNTDAPQGFVNSPVLFTLNTNLMDDEVIYCL